MPTLSCCTFCSQPYTYEFPLKEVILSALPICDEFVLVNGDDIVRDLSYDEESWRDKYSDLVDDKDDLPHICGYFAGECDFFITTNRRLTRMVIKGQVNFITPKELLKKLKLESIDTRYEI